MTRSNSSVGKQHHHPLITKPTITADNFDAPEPPSVFVLRWVDYSSKYGLGFMLSDNSTGVHFNDGSKIIGEEE